MFKKITSIILIVVILLSSVSVFAGAETKVKMYAPDGRTAVINQKDVSAREMSLSIGQNKNYINIIENASNLPSLVGLILIY